MSGTTNESEDGLLSKYHIESPLVDESTGGSSGGGTILKKGPWTSNEDAILVDYVKKHGEGNWNAVQKHSGLSRCGKSCRLRWANHLRPNLKKGAFTPDEEALILELHAKMGNKWARMAAHLPGRTDNEIKNYWNTRVKRRQRAGLPVYPPDIQAFQENQLGLNPSVINSGERGQHDPLQSSYEIPDIVFDGLKGGTDVYPYVSEMPDMYVKSIASPQFYSFRPKTIHRQKRRRESPDEFDGGNNGFPQFDQFQSDTFHKVASSFGPPFPHEFDPSQNLLCFDATQGGHSLPNGNNSASQPTDGASKLELPSLQYLETDLGTWSSSPPPPLLESADAYIQSPPRVEAYESNCMSPRNSGLLEALLYEAKYIAGGKKRLAEKCSNSPSFTPGDMADDGLLNMRDTDWEGYRESISPLSHAVTSLFSECLNATEKSLDQPPAAEGFMGSHAHVKSEPTDMDLVTDKDRELKKPMDALRPDAMLASEWYEPSSGLVADRMTDAIAALLGDDLVTDLSDLACAGLSSQEWGSYSHCAWNSMPSAICQMSDRS